MTKESDEKTVEAIPKDQLYTEEQSDKLVNYVRMGVPVDTAAIAAGIPRGTLSNWKRKAERQQDINCMELWSRIEKAHAEAEVRDLAIISKASEGAWQAAAWKLQRRHPERYGDQSQIVHTGPDGQPIRHEHSGIVLFVPTKAPIENDPNGITDQEMVAEGSKRRRREAGDTSGE